MNRQVMRISVLEDTLFSSSEKEKQSSVNKCSLVILETYLLYAAIDNRKFRSLLYSQE